MLRNEPAQETRRSRNKLDKLARIEKAGRVLFAKRGFDATTTRAIAARADIGIGTLFLYFAKKEDLLVHLFHRDIGAVQQEMFASLPARPLRRQLLHIVDALYAYYARDPALSRVFVKELLFLDAPRRDRVTALTLDFLERIVALITAAQARGEIVRALEPRQLAYAAFGLYCFTLINWLGGVIEDREVARAQLRASLDLLLAGLTVREKTR
ncbi:MAG TPA: TetR/AcrR family transcriptional regulator [Candidatus Dormibacteraeota bacterium]|nr:TetR/AcrR family transcriptional regulator [Candidatus Dormibacteraeota bacterium]